MSLATQPHHDFALGWLQDWNGHLGAAGANNTGANNAYFHANPDKAWMVFAAPNGNEYQHKDLNQFSQTAGENNGRQMSNNEKNQILNGAGIPTSPERLR